MLRRKLFESVSADAQAWAHGLQGHTARHTATQVHTSPHHHVSATGRRTDKSRCRDPCAGKTRTSTYARLISFEPCKWPPNANPYLMSRGSSLLDRSLCRILFSLRSSALPPVSKSPLSPGMCVVAWVVNSWASSVAASPRFPTLCSADREASCSLSARLLLESCAHISTTSFLGGTRPSGSPFQPMSIVTAYLVMTYMVTADAYIVMAAIC